MSCGVMWGVVSCVVGVWCGVVCGVVWCGVLRVGEGRSGAIGGGHDMCEVGRYVNHILRYQSHWCR